MLYLLSGSSFLQWLLWEARYDHCSISFLHDDRAPLPLSHPHSFTRPERHRRRYTYDVSKIQSEIYERLGERILESCIVSEFTQSDYTAGNGHLSRPHSHVAHEFGAELWEVISPGEHCGKGLSS